MMYTDQKMRVSQELQSLNIEELQKKSTESIIDQMTSHLKSSISEARPYQEQRKLPLSCMRSIDHLQSTSVQHLEQQEEPVSGNKLSNFTLSKSNYINEPSENRNIENLRVQDLRQQESIPTSSYEFIKEFSNNQQKCFYDLSKGGVKELGPSKKRQESGGELVKAVNGRILKLIQLCKNLNPVESQKNTKFSLLKQTLGLPFDQKENETEHQNYTLEELFQSLEQQITQVVQSFEKRDETRKDMHEKMVQSIKSQCANDIQLLVNEYEEKIQRLKDEYAQNLIGMDEKISLDQERFQQNNYKETQEILFLNRENERAQETIQNLQQELGAMREGWEEHIGAEGNIAEGELELKFKKKKEKLKEKMKSKLLNIQAEEQRLHERSVKDLKQKLDLAEKEVQRLKKEMDRQEGKVKEEGGRLLEIRGEEEQKYEKRLALVKKMHEEQINEVKKVNEEREREVEDKLFQFNRQKEKLYQKAKEDALKQEKHKREKFKNKLERIKQQEIAIVKRESKEAICELKQQLEDIVSGYSSMKADYQKLQQEAVVFPSNPNQSFYPTKKPTELPGLDINSLQNSISAFNSQIKDIEKGQLNKAKVLSTSQNNSQSQNRLEKYKQKILGTNSTSNNQSLNASQSFQNNATLPEGKLEKILKVQNSNSKQDQVKSFTLENQKYYTFNQEKQIQELEEEKHIQANCQIQCSLGEKQFEPFDYRVCLRCGQNDSLSNQSCSFHPFKCLKKGGAGKLLYSQEWHQCREQCFSDNSPSKEGCTVYEEHYYGSHLPYQEERKNKQKNKQVSESRVKTKASKEVMTEISLMFNPFKSTLNQSSQRSPIRGQDMNQSFRDSRSVSQEIIERTVQERSLSKSKRLDKSRSSILRQQNSIMKNNNSQTSTQMVRPPHHIAKQKREAVDEEQKTSRLRISPFKNELESYMSQSELSSLRNKQEGPTNNKHYQTDSGRGTSSPMLQSKYLKTEQQEKGLGDSKLSISALGKLEKSQNEWIKVEEYLTTSQRNY